MGIGATELKFLLYSKNKFGEFKKVLTLGRQQIGIENFEIKEILKNDCKYKIYDYCEDLLKDYFGASQVDSIDFSDYEGCTYTHDIGEEINLIQKYDTIIDFGTTEHVFNVGQAFKNIHKISSAHGDGISELKDFLVDQDTDIKENENKDPREIVIDEVIGQAIPIYLYETTHGATKSSEEAVLYYVYIFILFRFFDIKKPFPINIFDKKFKNSFGVIFDDVIAGLYVVLTLIIFMIIKSNFF